MADERERERERERKREREREKERERERERWWLARNLISGLLANKGSSEA